MDVRLYKLAPTFLVQLPGSSTFISLRPLSNTAIEQAELDAKLLFEAKGCECSGPHFELEKAAQTLALSMDTPVKELRENLNVIHLHYLYSRWQRIQAALYPNIDKLKTHLRKRVNDDADIMHDGIAAYHSKSASEYYGKPSSELTSGQIAYYLLLRSAYEEFHVPDDKGRVKKATKEWLEKN